MVLLERREGELLYKMVALVSLKRLIVFLSCHFAWTVLGPAIT